MHSLFIAASLTIGKVWKQPKCPSTDEWIKKWYIHTVECYSAMKKDRSLPLAATRQIDLEGILLTSHQIEEDRYCMISLTCGVKKSNEYNNKKRRATDAEDKLVVTTAERKEGKGNVGVGRKRAIMGLYEIMCVKLLKIVKHHRILEILHSVKKI